jgi:hypothetical protein
VHTSLIRPLVAGTTALLLTACGGGGSAPDAAAPSAGESTSTSTAASPSEAAESTAPQSDGQVVDITINGDDVSPNGERVKVGIGEPVTLHITANRAGALHVHSTPEQEVEFAEGETDAELTLDTPGVVEVEDHGSGKVIIQLQVS